MKTIISILIVILALALIARADEADNILAARATVLKATGKASPDVNYAPAVLPTPTPKPKMTTDEEEVILLQQFEYHNHV
jgi:hypothetical protein